MKTIKVQSGQTFFDIALQEYGCVEGELFILEDNNLSSDSDAYTGQELQIRELVDITKENKKIQQALTEIKVQPNSQIRNERPLVIYVETDYVQADYVGIE